MQDVMEYLIALFLIVSGVFGLVGSFGLLKLGDPMSRLHAPTKATTLGVGGVLIASMIHAIALEGKASFHELLITLFLFLTAPISAHFIGSIVYVERGLSTVTSQEALLVIDGQQRLTTSALLIAALAKHFEDKGVAELLEAFSAKKLRNYYLLNPDEEGERHFKLILSETDKDTLLAILKGAPMPAEISSRIEQNYGLFQDLIQKHEGELEAICQGLAKLVIVDVSLDRSQDNPQLIFESMNSTGLELSQADLIRNYILMGLEPKLQTELYKNYWRTMEKAFGQAAYVTHFDPFMRHYLTAKTGEIPNVREVYAAFKAFARDSQIDTKALVADRVGGI